MAKTLEKFTLFPKLPIELRTKIWEESISEPRVVVVYISNFGFKTQFCITFASSTPVPAILHVGREARQAGLKHYTLSFGSYSDKFYKGEPTIYVNMKKDTVYFPVSDISTLQGY
jgi:hypothetical protein